MPKRSRHAEDLTRLAFALAGVLALAAGILGYLFYTERQSAHELRTKLAAAEETAHHLDTNLNTANEALAQSEQIGSELADRLREEQHRNDAFAAEINEIAGTVGILEKLSETDEELLQKYSKVYFLNEHYIPDDLSTIDKEWRYDESRKLKIHEKVEPFLNDMLEDALDDDVKLWVVSAYRSWGTQADLKSAYTVTFGSGANAFSAEQGYSEHQLGTAIDFTTEGLGGGLSGFGETEGYEWLLKNAHKYGFTLSYPEDNAYYIFEPWHWRFVGTELAKDLHRDDAHFYDWDQRDINEYLISIFD